MGIGVIASMFVAGWLTGYLSKRHCQECHLGALYGFLAWTVALLITVLIVSQVQQYMSVYGHFITGSTDMVQVSTNSSNVAVVTTTKHLVATSYIIFALFS